MVYNRDHRNSAFESYKKPTSPSDIKQPSTEGEEKTIQHMLGESGQVW